MSINFIAAENGAIEMYDREEGFVVAAETAKTISYFLKEYGYEYPVATSSSIDFASEYGFENDEAAKELWEAGEALYHATFNYEAA